MFVFSYARAPNELRGATFDGRDVAELHARACALETTVLKCCSKASALGDRAVRVAVRTVCFVVAAAYASVLELGAAVAANARDQRRQQPPRVPAPSGPDATGPLPSSTPLERLYLVLVAASHWQECAKSTNGVGASCAVARWAAAVARALARVASAFDAAAAKSVADRGALIAAACELYEHTAPFVVQFVDGVEKCALSVLAGIFDAVRRVCGAAARVVVAVRPLSDPRPDPATWPRAPPAPPIVRAIVVGVCVCVCVCVYVCLESGIFPCVCIALCLHFCNGVTNSCRSHFHALRSPTRPPSPTWSRGPTSPCGESGARV
jgi:hypothetical protein